MVNAGGGVVEHGSPFRSRIALGQPFESIKYHIVGVGDLIHREVAFKHTPAWAELLGTLTRFLDRLTIPATEITRDRIIKLNEGCQHEIHQDNIRCDYNVLGNVDGGL